MSLNRGCEERPSRRKEGWEVGTDGAGAGAGPPEEWEEQQLGVSDHVYQVETQNHIKFTLVETTQVSTRFLLFCNKTLTT